MNHPGAKSADARKDNPLRTSIRRLSAIMFTDLVGYSALVQRDEPLAMQLLDAHRHMVRAALPGFGGREVETAGDAFLIEFASALEAVRCAIVIQKNHAAYNANCAGERQVQTRIGIHLGDVEHRGKSVFGDGVNIAARIEPHAPPGGIALSAPLHTQVAQTFKDAFRSLGPTALKNIAATMEIFVLDAAAIGALPAPEPRKPGLRQRVNGLRLAVGAGIAVAALLLAVLVRPLFDSPPVDKSVAVLPLVNLSENPAASDYLVGGMHESILTDLARMKNLKVISRTSVMEYQGANRNLREIAKALRVAHLVEGSVQRVGQRLRVTAQLIEVANGKHLWADSYERDISDLFAIQSEVAARVAGSIQVALTEEEKSAIQRRPTQNADAYDFYLRAMDYWRKNIASRDNLFLAQPLLEQAIALDPGFALAHAQLARVHLLVNWFSYDSDPTRLDKAKLAAETALGLQPELDEAHLAMGAYHYVGRRDYEGALREYSVALRLRPNSAEVHRSIGNVQRQLGRWNESVASLNKALELDPRNFNEIKNLAFHYRGLRRYDEAAPLYEHAIAIAPGDVLLRLERGWFYLDWKGDLNPLKQALDAVPAGLDPDNLVSFGRISVASLEGHYADAERLLATYPSDWLPGSGGTGLEPKELFLGWLQKMNGQTRKAQETLQRARDVLLNETRKRPESIGEYAYLAVAHAYLGERDAALRAVQEARTRASGIGTTYAMLGGYIANAFVILRETDQALDEIESLLKVPYGASAHFVRLDPSFKPLHGHPRFQKLIAENLPRD